MIINWLLEIDNWLAGSYWRISNEGEFDPPAAAIIISPFCCMIPSAMKSLQYVMAPD